MAKYPLKVDGIMGRVWEVGHGDRPVVLIHDLSLRADWWRSNLKVLGASGLRAISFDLPGHGFADKTTAYDHSLKGYAGFIAAFCRHLALERPILMGSGMGAQVAMMAAQQMQASAVGVAGLVLASPTGVVPVGPAVRAAMAEALFDTSRAGAARRIDAMVGDRSSMNADWPEEEFQICASPGQAEVFDILRPMVAEGLDRQLIPGLKPLTASVPTLVVWGERDALMPPSLMRPVLDALDDRAQHVLIEGAGHAPQFDRADDFNAAVVGFTTGFQT